MLFGLVAAIAVAQGTPPVTPGPEVTVHFDGLIIAYPGRETPAAFTIGSRTPRLIAAVNAAFGERPRIERATGCGSTPIDKLSWPNGLTLLVSRGRFVGWETRAAGFNTVNEIDIGTTRRTLEDMPTRRMSLGTQFAYDADDWTSGFGGVLDGPGPDSRVTLLWAGRHCPAQ